MNDSSTMKDLLRTRAGRTSACLVLLTGTLLGLLAFITLLHPGQSGYVPDFGSSNAIEDPSGAPSAYFRKTIHLAEDARFAWIQIAATDAYQLYVNGERVGRNVFRSTWATGIYDVTRLLHPGENVIGVEVDRLSYPGSAQTVVLGAVHPSGAGPSLPIRSDGSWRSSPTPGAPGPILPWHHPGFDDLRWARARERPRPLARAAVRPLAVNPVPFQAPPSDRWIRLPEAGAGPTLLSMDAALSDRPDEGWVQLSSTAGWELFINGSPVARSDEGSGPHLLVFPVGRHLRPGRNRFTLRPHASGRDTDILLEAFFLRSGRLIGKIQASGGFSRDTSRSDSSSRPTPLSAGSGGAGQRFRHYQKRHAPEVLVAPPFFPAIWGVPASAAGGLLLLALWLIPCRLRSRSRPAALGAILERDALYHLPVALAAAVALLLRYDVRLSPETAASPPVLLGICTLFLAMKTLSLLPQPPRKRTDFPSARPAARGRTRRRAVAALLLAIAAAGLVYRLAGLDEISLDHDELSIVSMAKGVAQAGYPHRPLGAAKKVLTTYEIVPYPVALSCLSLGWNEWGARMPAVLFGTGTLLLLGWIGIRHLSWKTGLLAAALYALLPSAVLGSRNAFHMQQTQFFALLCLWAFWLAIRRRPCAVRPLVLATLAFVATYLSWEGSGFLFPALCLALVVRRWGDWSWLRERPLWLCGGLVMMMVALQQGRRILHQAEYSALGTGLSQVKAPALFFLDPRWEPLFYVKNFLWVENHSLLTLALLLTLPLLLRRPFARYLLLLLGTLLFCYTNLLSAYSSRYVYFLLPLVVLLAAEGTAKGVESAGRIARRLPGAGERALVRCCGAALVLLLLLGTNATLFRLYALSSSPARPKPNTRLGVYRIDYRGAGEFLKRNWNEGDLIIPNVPLAVEHYAGLSGDYYLNTLALKRVLYDPNASVPRYMERFAGYPVIRSPEELRESLHRAERAWILVAPVSGFVTHNDPEVVRFLDREARVVHESYRTQVYLWDP